MQNNVCSRQYAICKYRDQKAYALSAWIPSCTPRSMISTRLKHAESEGLLSLADDNRPRANLFHEMRSMHCYVILNIEYEVDMS